jgi:glycosyltransferase involved in cell wall biosynthesis
MTQRMKILVIAGRYGISGVPLAQMRFARALAKRGHEVELVYGMVNEGHALPYLEDVVVRSLEKPRVSQMLLPLSRYFRKGRPDIVFSAGDHLNVIVLMAAILSRTRAKLSCSSRVTPFDTYSTIPFSKGWILKIMARLTMWRADVLTCVSADMVDQYRAIFKNARHACAYNIIDDAYSRQAMAAAANDPWLEDKRKPLIVAAGSLVPWKGFNDLIVAMSKVVEQVGARLLILGEGPMRAELTELIGRYGLGDAVRLLGNVDNPLAYFSRADVFVLCSYVEGLPNVLVEAMLCGCTPVATNCPTGPREVLQDGKHGYLVPMRDPASLAGAIVSALQHPVPAEQLLTAIHQFREDAVIARHFNLLGLDRVEYVLERSAGTYATGR